MSDSQNEPHGDDRQPRPLLEIRTGSWWRLMATIAAGLFVGLGLLGGLWIFARALGVIILAIAIAAALEPVVSRFEQWMRRSIAVVVVYALLLLVLGLFFWAIVPNLAAQLQQFIDNIPQYVERIEQFLSRQGWVSDQAAIDTATSQLQQFGSAIITTPITVFSIFLEVVLVFVIALYLLIQSRSIEEFALSLVPARRREHIQSVAAEMLQASGGFVRGIVIDAVIVAVITFIGFSLIGLPFPLVLAVLVGAFEALPVIGAIIVTFPVVIVALLQSPTTAIITFIFFLIVQQVEGNILVPNIMHEQAKLSPLLVVILIFVGGNVGGPLGALTAIPLAAALRVFFIRVIVPQIREQTGAPQSG